MALRHKGLIVGIKTAHYEGPEWAPVERAVEAGTIADVPVMVDFGADRPERPLAELRRRRSCARATSTPTCTRACAGELDAGGPRRTPAWSRAASAASSSTSATAAAASRGAWRCPRCKEGFWPDAISTDLHIGSMNAGMKDQLNVMSKFLALGLSLEDVIAQLDLEPRPRDRSARTSGTSRWAPRRTWRC